MTNEPLFFFEQTDFSLRFARCAISESSLHIEELREVSINDTGTLAQLAPAGTPVVCALRPKPRQLHLASIDEAKRYTGLAGLQQFAQLPVLAKGEPAWFAGVQASDGAPPTSTPWLMSVSSTAAHEQARSVFESIKLKPARCLDATLATIGALASTVSSPTLLLEIGELTSHAVLIGNKGVLAARGVTLNLDQIAEAVRIELDLKFRGSAAKLLFNPDCDFKDAGPKIAARLGAALKADLVPLLAGHAAPTTLCCAGLPALQRWLEIELATVLGLAPHAPDITTWSTTVGMTFGSPVLAASIAPAWFNFLHFINAQTLESSVAVAWQAELLSVKAPVAAPNARPVTNPPLAAGTHRPAKSATTPPFAAAAPTPPPALAKPAPLPAPAPAKAAVPSVRYSSKPTPQTAPIGGESKTGGKNKMPLFIGIGVAVVALLGVGFFYLQSQKEEIARIALAKQKAAQRINVEEQRARLAEQRAHEEAENRKKFEFEAGQKLALAETARQQAEAEARNQTATRLANARGTLIVTTQPAGATVTVGALPPRPSPATFPFIGIGKYPVTITLVHHEDVKLELEVTENNTTESGPIPLTSLAGSVALTTEPAGVSYELRPANAFTVTSDARRTGQTPATIDDLDPGDYSLTFSQPGWASHTETISVARGSTARAAWAFPSGTVNITSSPRGATVSHDGAVLGLTPLTLRQPPGIVQYELKLAFHDIVTLPGRIEDGKTLELTAQLPTSDLVYGATEMDKIPEPINPKTPALPSLLTLVEGKVVIQMMVGRDGTPSDLKIVRASNPEIGKLYLAALAKWKFKPGQKDGNPVRSVVAIPFLIAASRD